MPTTPYMSLVLPTVSVTAGPTWATNLNSAFDLVDAHDHTTGKGVTLTQASFSITGDVEFNSNDATELRSVRFDSQSSALAVGTDIGCLYNLSGAPTWNDNSATASRIVNTSYPMAVGDLIYASSTTAFGRLAIGATGTVLKVSGGLPTWASNALSATVSTKTGTDYTLQTSDDVVLFSCGASNRTANLPTASGNGGKIFYIKKIDPGAGTVIIDGVSSETIDGATTYTLVSQYQSVTIISNGSAWYIL